MAAVAAERGANGGARIVILAFEEQGLGERQGGVDILVGRAVAGQAGGEPVAQILDADAGDGDMLPLRRRGLALLRRSGGGKRGQQSEEESVTHGGLRIARSLSDLLGH